MPIPTYVSEFPHSRVIVHFHPDKDDGGDFSAEQVKQALARGVHAVELDLFFRQEDNSVACAHEAEDLSVASPSLTQIIQVALDWKGQGTTVQGDEQQFFFVLDLKEADPRLFDGLYGVLQERLSVLSTTVQPGEGPRPITVVLSGGNRISCYGYLLARYGEQINRLFVVEDYDYTGWVVNLSGDDPVTTFQWKAVRYREQLSSPPEGEWGRVNGLHVGRDPSIPGRYNVRIWDTKSNAALRFALASGADSISCNLSDISGFSETLRSQKPRGIAPWLTVRAGRALLTWQGGLSDSPPFGLGYSLYLADGTLDATGLVFPRQVSLTRFLAQQPRAIAPSATLLSDGRILMVYEGTSSQRLWYLSGRFVSADRFLTFEGRENLLTLPDDSGWRGSAPSVAIAPDGRVIIVYEGTEEKRLWYFSGYLNPSGQLIGTEYELTKGDARRGSTPSVAMDPGGRIIVLYEGTDEHRLWYVAGRLDGGGGIVGEEHELSDGSARRGYTPCAAFDGQGRIIVVYQGTDQQRLFYVSGRLQGEIIQGTEFSLTEGQARRGFRPTVGFDGTDRVAILYQGTDAEELWYFYGNLDESGRILGEERLLDMSVDPR